MSGSDILCYTESCMFPSAAKLGQGGGGGVTPIDSLVAMATTLGQWSKQLKRMQSMVEACSEAWPIVVE